MPSELSVREIPEGYLQQEIKTSCRICHVSTTPQPLTGAHGPGPAAARIVLTDFLKNALDARCRSGLQLLQGFSDDHDDVDQRLGNNLATFIIICIQIAIYFWFIREKRVLNTPRPVHHESHIAPRHPHSYQLSGVEGVDLC